METLHNKKQSYPSKNNNNNKKQNSSNKNTKNTTDRPTPIKVYFPNISINKMNDILNPNKKKW